MLRPSKYSKSYITEKKKFKIVVFVHEQFIVFKFYSMLYFVGLLPWHLIIFYLISGCERILKFRIRNIVSIKIFELKT